MALPWDSSVLFVYRSTYVHSRFPKVNSFKEYTTPQCVGFKFEVVFIKENIGDYIFITWILQVLLTVLKLQGFNQRQLLLKLSDNFNFTPLFAFSNSVTVSLEAHISIPFILKFSDDLFFKSTWIHSKCRHTDPPNMKVRVNT